MKIHILLAFSIGASSSCVACGDSCDAAPNCGGGGSSAWTLDGTGATISDVRSRLGWIEQIFEALYPRHAWNLKKSLNI